MGAQGVTHKERKREGEKGGGRKIAEAGPLPAHFTGQEPWQKQADLQTECLHTWTVMHCLLFCLQINASYDVT